MSRMTFIERRVEVLGGLIGPEAATAAAHRDALRAVGIIFGWVAFIPAITWARMAGGVLAWSVAALAFAGTFAIFTVSIVFGHRMVVDARVFVGNKLGYPVRLGSCLSRPREWQMMIAMEKELHAQGRTQPRWGVRRMPKDPGHPWD